MKTLVIATHNQGKLEEYQLIFKKALPGVTLTSLSELGITKKAKESGKTLEANAIQKASFYSRFTKLPTLADDGGLEIDYLDGEPGVQSRRWPGYEASDEELIQMTLDKLQGVPLAKRGAQLRMVLALSFPGERKLYTSEGILRGFISEKPIGKRIKGYPFRSVFYLPQKKKMFSETSLVAHREEAVYKVLPTLKKKLA